MTKFNVGDRVRYTCPGHTIGKDGLGTITGLPILNGSYYTIQWDDLNAGNSRGIGQARDENLELVNDKFKPGDRIHYTYPNHFLTKDTGTIVERQDNNDEGYVVTWDSPIDCEEPGYALAKYLEPLVEARFKVGDRVSFEGNPGVITKTRAHYTKPELTVYGVSNQPREWFDEEELCPETVITLTESELEKLIDSRITLAFKKLNDLMSAS